jgi:hypothetical protein
LQTFSRASCAAWEERANGTVCARVEDGAEVVVEKCGGGERRRRRLGRTRARVKARMVERVGARAGGIMRGKKAAVGGHISGLVFAAGLGFIRRTDVSRRQRRDLAQRRSVFIKICR